VVGEGCLIDVPEMHLRHMGMLPEAAAGRRRDAPVRRHRMQLQGRLVLSLYNGLHAGILRHFWSIYRVVHHIIPFLLLILCVSFRLFHLVNVFC